MENKYKIIIRKSKKIRTRGNRIVLYEIVNGKNVQDVSSGARILRKLSRELLKNFPKKLSLDNKLSAGDCGEEIIAGIEETTKIYNFCVNRYLSFMYDD